MVCVTDIKSISIEPRRTCVFLDQASSDMRRPRLSLIEEASSTIKPRCELSFTDWPRHRLGLVDAKSELNRGPRQLGLVFSSSGELSWSKSTKWVSCSTWQRSKRAKASSRILQRRNRESRLFFWVSACTERAKASHSALIFLSFRLKKRSREQIYSFSTFVFNVSYPRYVFL